MADYPFKLNYHHTGIFVSDMEASIKWYEEMLGYKLMYKNVFDLPGQGLVDMCWIKHQDHYIELYQYRYDQKPFSVEDYLTSLGTKHLCLWVEDGQLEPLTAYLEERNVDFWVKNHKWTKEQCGKPTGCGVIYVKDPDGVLIEIQESFLPGEYEE